MRLADFVLVEFARAWQEEQGAAVIDPEIVAATRARGDFEGAPEDGRLVLYARELLDQRVPADEGRDAPHRLRMAWQALTWLAPLLGLLLGGALVEATLPPNDVRPVNVFHVVGEGILLPAVFLAFSVAVAAGVRLPGPLLHWGAVALAFGQRGLLRTRLGALAGRVLQRSGISGPLLAGLSHRLWLGLLISFLGVCTARFAVNDYLFSWSSTVPVTGGAVGQLFDVLVAPVGWIPGVDAPGTEQIDMSQYATLDGRFARSTGDPLRDDLLRKGWWSPLLAAVAFWGLLPRLLAFGATLLQVRRGIARALATPGHRALALALDAAALRIEQQGDGGARPAPVAPPIAAPPAPLAAEPVEPAPPRWDAEPAAPRLEAQPASALRVSAPTPASPAPFTPGQGLDVVAFATAAPPSSVLADLRLARLGLTGRTHAIEDDDEDDAIDALLALLATPASRPGGALVVFAVGATPGRVRGEFLASVCEALDGAPVHVVLTGVAAFAAGPRGAHLDQRLAGWRRLAVDAGVSAERVWRDDGSNA